MKFICFVTEGGDPVLINPDYVREIYRVEGSENKAVLIWDDWDQLIVRVSGEIQEAFKL